MRAPALRGRIDRRISVFYRLDPMAARSLLPAPLRPRLVRGWALGGVCILRLARMRPRMLPIPLGLASELAWHRIAVEWEEEGRPMHGHYLLRSETDSRLAPFPGARLVPSPDDCTRIEVRSSDAALTARVESGDGTTDLDLAASLGSWRSDALFKSANAARASIASGHVVWDGDEQGELEGVELRSTGGTAQGLEVVRLVRRPSALPPGSGDPRLRHRRARCGPRVARASGPAGARPGWWHGPAPRARSMTACGALMRQSPWTRR